VQRAPGSGILRGPPPPPPPPPRPGGPPPRPPPPPPPPRTQAKDHASLDAAAPPARGADGEPSTSGTGAEGARPPSIARMTTAEWRAKYEADGTVDLFVEEEFNAGSRLIVRFFGGVEAVLGGWAEAGAGPLPFPAGLPHPRSGAAGVPPSLTRPLLTPPPTHPPQGGRAVHWGGVAGMRTGEGPSMGDVPRHTITIHNPRVDQTVTVEVPEDR
jgi:hypothetical protein